MRKAVVQQRTERRISGILRLVLVAVLLALQIAVMMLLNGFLQRQMAIIYSVIQLLALVVSVAIYNRQEGTGYKLVWILLILAFPVAGLLLYVLWGGAYSSKRLTLKPLPRPVESAEKQSASRDNIEALRLREPQWCRLASYLDRRGFLLYDHTEVTYLPTGAAYLEDMLAHMEQARRFIFMEHYIVARGQLWDRFMEVLRTKCTQGVEVKILFDDFGSMMRFGREEVGALRHIGAEVMVFNPVHQYVNRLYFNYRDHRKIACIDGDISYTGGVNIADEYAGLTEKFGYWKDCGVRLEGQGAWELTREFLYMWQRMDGTLAMDYDAYRPRTAPEGQGYCQTVADGPDNGPVAAAEDTFFHLITGAQRSVWITSPYLAVDEAMLRALTVAGDAGLDVRLIMPGIPDHQFAFLVAESYFGYLMKHGVKVYTFTPGMLHGKTVLVDEEIAFVGSVNMDYRSFQLHFECGVVLYGAPPAEELTRDYDKILRRSHQLTEDEWHRRPWIHKLLGPVLRLFAMWM